MGCNHFTATRADVGAWMWEWERHIPFVPAMVVPYWSLDLFFVAAFFICRSRADLSLLTRRLIANTVASGLCYLLFPLKMGLPRPEPTGWTAPLFEALYAGDLPYNLAPSLHISLRSLLWICYGAHLTGWLRGVTKFWFILIGLSTLLVWQHHVIDVASGFLMAWFITAVVPDRRQAQTCHPSAKLASRYGLGAVVAAALAFGWFGFAWLAVGLGIMALAYATGRARYLGKENGTLSPAAEWCLLPVMLATRWIQRRWSGRQPAWHEIGPGVMFGRRLKAAEARALVAAGPLAVLDLTAESTALPLLREQTHYHSLPMLDLVPPSSAALAAAVAFVCEQQAQRRVYIHCQLGLQRSALVAQHWLVRSGRCADGAAAQKLLHELNAAVVLP
jgi:hypothetical protein